MRKAKILHRQEKEELNHFLIITKKVKNIKGKDKSI